MPSSLKILIFNWRCWTSPDAGGAEVFTHENARRWVNAGHEVTLFASKYRNCKEEEYIDGVRIVRAGGRFSIYWKAKSYYKKFFSRENYDIVLDEINTRPFFTPKFVCGEETVVALIHQLAREYWFYETPFPISYLGYYILEDMWLKQYVNIPTITVSESTLKDLMHLGLRELFVVSEGLGFTPLNQLPEKERFPVVAFTGRLKKAKRPDHAIKSFSIVKKRIPEAELWIIGKGYFENELKGIAPNGVRFFGSVSDRERRELLKKAWVVVNPSVREGFGLNIIEANALGTPCVAYNVAGLRDSIENFNTGLLVDAPNFRNGNMEGFSDAIAKILENEGLRERLSINSLRKSNEFSWDKSTEDFLNIFRKVINAE